VPICIVDNNCKNMHMNHNIMVCDIKKAIELSNDYVVVISAPKYRTEIRQQLKEYVDEEKNFDFEAEIYCSFISDIEVYKKYLKSNWDRIEKIYNCLSDEKSKDVLEAFIMGRLTGNQDYFNKVMIDNQYYTDELLKFSNQEVMVEIGSNNGETLLKLLDIVNRKFKSVYCFEPDKECIRALRKVIEEENGNIVLIEKGAWDKATKLSFESDSTNGASQIVEGIKNNSYDIETDTVDNCVSEMVSFIKMDIEGAEKKALLGCENTIKKYKPRLAICIYHNKEDLLDIAEYVKCIVQSIKYTYVITIMVL